MLRTGWLDLAEIGALAQEWRIAARLKQSEVGDLCGVTQSGVSAFERGKSASLTLFLWYLNHGAFDVLDTENPEV